MNSGILGRIGHEGMSNQSATGTSTRLKGCPLVRAHSPVGVSPRGTGHPTPEAVECRDSHVSDAWHGRLLRLRGDGEDSAHGSDAAE